jgi:hypothetical protein
MTRVHLDPIAFHAIVQVGIHVHSEHLWAIDPGVAMTVAKQKGTVLHLIERPVYRTPTARERAMA